jgi:hypothetical protein
MVELKHTPDYGVKDDRGINITVPIRCALTNELIVGGCSTTRIPGTRLFYKLTSSSVRRINWEQREAIRLAIIAADRSKNVPESESAQPEPVMDAPNIDEADYGKLTDIELNNLALSRGLLFGPDATREDVTALLETLDAGDYDKLTKDTLMSVALERGLVPTPGMVKAAIVDMLEADDYVEGDEDSEDDGAVG